MKSLFFKRALLLGFLALTVVVLQAQPDLPDLPDADSGVNLYLGWVEVIYGALFSIISWFSAWIPGFNKISDKAMRIAAIAIVGAAIFIFAGFSTGIPLFISFLIATKAYDLIIKKIAPTPDTPADIARKEKTLQESKAYLAKTAA